MGNFCMIKLRLSFERRLRLVGVLDGIPAPYMVRKRLNKIQDSLAPTDEETAAAKFTVDSAAGLYKWDPNHTPAPVEISLAPADAALLASSLTSENVAWHRTEIAWLEDKLAVLRGEAYSPSAD